MTNMKKLTAALYPKVNTDIDLLQILTHGAVSVEEMIYPDKQGIITIDTLSCRVILNAERQDLSEGDYKEVLDTLKNIIETVQRYLPSVRAEINCTWEVEQNRS